MLKKYWDHKVKPSQWVIIKDGEEAFRGTFSDGEIFIKSLENNGMISFEHDYIPAMQKLRKYCQRGHKCEQTLRRQIIKLKKELKQLKS